MYKMKKHLVSLSAILLLSSTLFSVENAITTANEKYAFVNDIYRDSWALIIGINKYQNVPQLNYAVDDAVSIKSMFTEKYGFKEDNVILITDEEATKDKHAGKSKFAKWLGQILTPQTVAIIVTIIAAVIGVKIGK